MIDQFSAKNPALGYLYQIRYALYLLLKTREEGNIAIELLDDVTWEQEGKPIELFQLKHHITNTASLTNSSPDFWKTIRVWSSHIKGGIVTLPDTVLTLVTTSSAPEDSIAALLRPGTSQEQRQTAYQKILEVATGSRNQDLKGAFDVFLSLPEELQKQLINAIVILDSSQDIKDISDEIKQLLIGVRSNHLDAVYETLEGWWLNIAIQSLASTLKDSQKIPRGLILDKVASINDEYKPDFLPIDYLHEYPPEPIDLNSDSRLFVWQLRAIMIQDRRIEKAILDYYRAFSQIGRWTRFNLLKNNELADYQAKLIDEWERYCDRLKDKSGYDDSTSEKCVEIGKQVYDWMESEADFRIRQRVEENYVMRGNFHLLANNNPPRIFWHPKFIDQLLQVITIPL